MAIYALGERVPQVHPEAYVHPDASVIGDVAIGAESTVWPGVVLRGDYGRIEIGSQTSVQDGTVVHAVPPIPTIIGDSCVIGHMVHLEGCTIEDWALVGSGSVVLHRAIVRSHSLVGANAVVSNDVEVPSGAMALGVPCQIRPDRMKPFFTKMAVESYIANGKRYREQLRRLD